MIEILPVKVISRGRSSQVCGRLVVVIHEPSCFLIYDPSPWHGLSSRAHFEICLAVQSLYALQSSCGEVGECGCLPFVCRGGSVSSVKVGQ